MISRAQLSTFTHDPDEWLIPLNNAMSLYEITTPAREAHFLAQCAHESGGFVHLVENLNYSPHVLLTVFPTHFKPEEAVDFAHDPERIANRVYANRMGNGDEASGDGRAFRGRGLIQLTGRANVTRCGQALGVNLADAPELLEQPVFASLSAAWYWAMRGLNAKADVGDFVGIVKAINGGTEGIEDRAQWLAKAQSALNAA